MFPETFSRWNFGQFGCNHHIINSCSTSFNWFGARSYIKRRDRNYHKVSLGYEHRQIDNLRSYTFQNVLVRTDHNIKELTFGLRSSCELVGKLDISTTEDITNEFVNCNIIGILNFSVHFSCLNCNSRINYIKDIFSRCSKCTMLQLVRLCKF